MVILQHKKQSLTMTSMHRKHLSLQPRDYALLQALSDYRYLTTTQLRDMFFSKGPFIYRRLKKLADYGLLTRIQREIIGSSSEFVHALSPDGAHHLSHHLGLPTSTFTIHRKASRNLLEHELALNVFRLAFEQAVGLHNDLNIEKWDTKFRIRLPNHTTLIPDAHVVLTTPRGKTHFFVELDRFTESIHRVFRKKLVTYAAYHQSGRFITDCQAKLFRVLVITSHAHAVTLLTSACHNIIPSGIFWFTHQNLIEIKQVLTGNIWQRLDRPNSLSALYKTD